MFTDRHIAIWDLKTSFYKIIVILHYFMLNQITSEQESLWMKYCNHDVQSHQYVSDSDVTTRHENMHAFKDCKKQYVCHSFQEFWAEESYINYN